MRRFFFRLAMLAAAILPALSPASAAAADLAATKPAEHLQRDAADLAPYLRAVTAEVQIPGMTAVVLRGERIVAEGAVGLRKLGSPDAVTIDDRFHLGSITKAMTATLAATFVDEGKLAWSATLADLFGELAPEMHSAWRAVTLQQLLSHRAGLPANYPARLRERQAASDRPLTELRREIVREMLAAAPDYAPGSKMVYSNTGYILAGAALEKISGRSWEELLRERVFAPLGITSAGFGAPGAPGKVEAPWGHGKLGRAWQGDNAPALGPAGTVHMAIRDWAKFVALHLRGHPANPHREVKLLQRDTFAWLHTPKKGETYHAGWVFEQRPALKGTGDGHTGRVLWHNGSNTAWYAIMVLAPEVDGATLFATNRFDPETVRACNLGARALLEFYFRRPDAK